MQSHRHGSKGLCKHLGVTSGNTSVECQPGLRVRVSVVVELRAILSSGERLKGWPVSLPSLLWLAVKYQQKRGCQFLVFACARDGYKPKSAIAKGEERKAQFQFCSFSVLKVPRQRSHCNKKPQNINPLTSGSSRRTTRPRKFSKLSQLEKWFVCFLKRRIPLDSRHVIALRST